MTPVRDREPVTPHYFGRGFGVGCGHDTLTGLGLGAGFGLLGAATMDHLPFFAVNDSGDLRSRFASSCI